MLRHHVSRRLSDRLDGIEHGPVRLGRQAADDLDRAGRRATPRCPSAAPATTGDDTWLKVYLYSRAQSVMGGTSQIQRNLIARRILELPTPMTSYDLPDVITVEADGPVRIVRLNRPDQLNATNHELHRRAGRALPAARRRPRRTGRGAHRQRPGLLGRRRLRLHRRAHRRRRPPRGEPPRRARTSSPAWWRAGSRSSRRSTDRRSASAAASSRCPTSCSWPRAPTSPTPTCSSAWSPPTADP